MIDPLEIVAVDVLLGAERPLVERALRPLVGNRPFRSIERGAVGFALQKILTDFRPDLFQHEADVGEDGIISPHAVLGLQEVPNTDYGTKRKQRDEHHVMGNKRSKTGAPAQASRERCNSHAPPRPRQFFRGRRYALWEGCRARGRSGAWPRNATFGR